MSNYLKLLVILCFNSAMVELSAFEWNISTSSSKQPAKHTNSAKSFISLERWATNQGRFWTEQYWLSGDFDGDGADDLARIFKDDRDVSIDVYSSNKKGSFTPKNWVAQKGRFWTEQIWLAGDFDGDGTDDIARAFKDDRYVSIDLYRSDKSRFTRENWAQQQGRFWEEQHWRAGDFDGDGADDIARMFHDNRMVSIDAYRSDKSRFIFENWVVRQGRFWTNQHLRAGDFDGDGDDDLVRVYKDNRNASMDVYRSDKSSFTFVNWVSQQGRFWEDQYWLDGDFDGDGAADVARVFKDNRDASFDIFRSDKKRFTIETLAQQKGRFWTEQIWRAGDFNGDGKDDIAKVFKDTRYVSIDVYLSNY